MTNFFKPESVKDEWDNQYNSEVLREVEKESHEKLEILTQAINENWTISQLLEAFPDDVIIHISDNASGVNVANLSQHTVSEWTW